VKKLSILVAALALLAVACGSGSSASSNADVRTIKVTMTDNKFSPSTVHVTKGEKITFTFVNHGTVDHEALVGDEMAQDDHEKDMAAGSDDMGGMDHGDSNVLTVKPGKTGTLTHTFDKAGTTLIGCHEKGHYADGMKLTVNVG
jgi:uncharacterized cupredoxin-like copper-binding protein